MPNDYISKLKSLSPSLQAKLADEKILAELDELDSQYGIKAVLILLGLLLSEIDYIELGGKLKADYGFNDFLAAEVKGKFGDLIKELGKEETAVAVKPAGREAPADYPMVFSQADEAEVKKYVNLSAAVPVDYSTDARRLIAAFGYPNADEIMPKRLENIIIARLKDVRDDLETKENLMKSKKVGGLEFSEAEADKLLGLIKNKSVLNARDSSITSVRQLADTSDFSRNDKYSGKINNANQPTIEMEDGLPVVRLPEALAIRPPADMAIKENPVIPAEKLPVADVNGKIKPATEATLPPPTPQPYLAAKKIPESVINAKTASKPNLDDVKLGKKLMGPIEELEMMTIIDFRRLAADPQAAVNKIKEKINLLGREGLDRRLAGVDAWQKSEVSRFYRLLGQLSMSENKTIEIVIKERLLAGKPTLSLDEFYAVMELNRTLRY